MLKTITPQIQPTKLSCAATAFAMCLDKPVKEIFDWLEHDGSFRTFHTQELIDFTIHKTGYIVTCIIPSPCTDNVHYMTDRMEQTRLLTYLRASFGVLTGVSQITNQGHAVAWDGLHMIDPMDGQKKMLGDRFDIMEYFMFMESNQFNE